MARSGRGKLGGGGDQNYRIRGTIRCNDVGIFEKKANSPRKRSGRGRGGVLTHKKTNGGDLREIQ